MKYLLLFAACCFSACSSQPHPKDDWFGSDKAQHFTLSALAAAGLTNHYEDHIADCDAPAVSISLVMLLGAGKEWSDKTLKGTYYSQRDMVWNFAGSVMGSLAASDCF